MTRRRNVAGGTFVGNHWRPARECDRCVRLRHQRQEDWTILCFANRWRVARGPCVTVLGWYRFPNMVILPLDQRLANSLTNCWTGDTVQPLEGLESVLSLYSQSRRIRAEVVQTCQASGPAIPGMKVNFMLGCVAIEQLE